MGLFSWLTGNSELDRLHKENAVVVKAMKSKGKSKKPNQRSGLTIMEKRLDIDVWKFKDKNHKGSHFPLQCYTCNTGRRSEKRYHERDRRGWNQ